MASSGAGRRDKPLAPPAVLTGPRWSEDGTWAKLLAAAQADADTRGELDWLVAADSSPVRVHQHGAAARRIGGNAATAVGPASPPETLTGGSVD